MQAAFSISEMDCFMFVMSTFTSIEKLSSSTLKRSMLGYFEFMMGVIVIGVEHIEPKWHLLRFINLCDSQNVYHEETIHLIF